MTIEERLESLESELDRVNRSNRRLIGCLAVCVAVAVVAWVLKPHAPLAQDTTSEEKVARLQALLDQERDEAERARLTQELVLKQLDPDLARAVQKITGGIHGINKDDDAATAIVKLFAQNIGDLRPERQADAAKDMNLDSDDLAALKMSRRPPSLTGEEASSDPEESTFAKLIALLTTPTENDSTTDSTATSQPVTTKPADNNTGKGSVNPGDDSEPTPPPASSKPSDANADGKEASFPESTLTLWGSRKQGQMADAVTQGERR